EVALDHDGAVGLADRVAREREAVERVALAEDRRLGGVEVLGRRLAARRPPGQDAAAEGDHLAARVRDREHDPLPEAVEHAAGALGPVAPHDEPGGERILERHALGAQVAREHLARARRPAEPEALDQLLGDAALAQVGARAAAAGAAQLGLAERRRRRVRPGALGHGAERLVAAAARHACCPPGRMPSACPASATVPAMCSSGRPSLDSAIFWLTAEAGAARSIRRSVKPMSAAALADPKSMPATRLKPPSRSALARRSAIRPRSAATTQVPTKTTAHPSGCAATGGARRSSSRTFAAAGPATPAASTPAIDPARPKASRQRPRE